MKRCQICGQSCGDEVKACPACGNKEFTQVSENAGQEFHANENPQSPYNWSSGADAVQKRTTTGIKNNGYAAQGVYNYEQDHMGEKSNLPNDEKMTKSQFYKACVPSDLKNKMAGGYAILILNFVVFLALAVWYEEPLRLVDCVVLLVILIGLAFTKNIGFAIADAVYFTVSCIINFVMTQQATGILAIIIAFSLIPVTYKIGKLWGNYKRTGEYVSYNMAAVNKKSAGRIVTILLSIVGIVLVIAAMIYIQDGGFASFERGTWDGQYYENESLNLSVEIPSTSWEIKDEEELEELSADAKSQAGFSKAEEFDSMVSNVFTGSNYMIVHLKGSFSEADAVQGIKTNLTSSYKEQYGAYPTITNAGKKYLAGEGYTRLDVRVQMYGLQFYQRIYVKKVGREICEIAFSGREQEALDEMEQFFSPLK